MKNTLNRNKIISARQQNAMAGRFKVTIIETLEMTVEVESENQEQAEQIVADRWKNGGYILDADNFADVKFEAVPAGGQED
mgnify:CR=1 FL=1